MSRYDPQGQTQIYWVTDIIADPAAPTVAEIIAGTRLDTMAVNTGVEGFEEGASTVDVTDLAARREKTVPGLATITNGKITFYRGDDPTDVEAILFDEFLADRDAKTDGFVVAVLAGEPAAGGLADVHPSQVNAVNASTSAGGTGARFMVDFTHPASSVLNAVIAI